VYQDKLSVGNLPRRKNQVFKVVQNVDIDSKIRSLGKSIPDVWSGKSAKESQPEGECIRVNRS